MVMIVPLILSKPKLPSLDPEQDGRKDYVKYQLSLHSPVSVSKLLGIVHVTDSLTQPSFLGSHPHF